MSGLTEISASDPAGSESPRLGDNRIRALANAILISFALEHTLSGAHKILIGSSGVRPAAGNAGRLYILTATGLVPALQYDTGAAWVDISDANDVTTVTADLAAHKAASPLDHPDASVTAARILAGAILKKHLAGGTDNGSIAALVDGTSADALHIHTQYGASAIVVTPEHLNGEFVSGNSIRARSVTSALATIGTSYVKVKEINVRFAGSIRVSFTAHMHGTGNLNARVYKNGSAIGVERIINVADTSYTYVEDFSNIAKADLIQIYAKLEDLGSAEGSLDEFWVGANWEATVTLE